MTSDGGRAVGWRILAVAAVTLALAVVAATMPAHAAPVPDCAGAPVPTAGRVAAGGVWRPDDLPTNWVVPACVGWPEAPFGAVVALGAHVDGPLDATVLLDRIARVSTMTDVEYWSDTKKDWRPLYTRTYRVAGPDDDAPLPDLDGPALRREGHLYALQEDDSPAGATIYRLDVRQANDVAVVLDATNVTAVSVFLFTIFDPGEIRIRHAFHRSGDGGWDYHMLMRLGTGASSTGLSDGTWLNRMNGVFRHMAGLPQRMEPPVAP